MGYRYLTDGELALATSIYGDGIDYSSIKIYDRAAGIFGVGVANTVTSPNGNIYYPKGDPRYGLDISAGTFDQKGTFIHELKHVDQHQDGVDILGRRLAEGGDYDFRDKISFDPKTGKAVFPFESWTIEEQAAFVEELYYRSQLLRGFYPSVSNTDLMNFREFSGVRGDFALPDRCFPAHTRIQTSRTTSIAISALRVGDVVLAFDATADKGRGALVPRRVTRLYRNATTEWIRLRWVDGTAREVITTPGHHFLDALGRFPTIEELTRTGSATVVLASGALAQVTAERIIFSAGTAHLFERAMGQGAVAGNAAVNPVALDAWQTYNIEVEDLHTYVAEGVRVHNDSGWLGALGTKIFSPGDDSRGHNIDQFGNVIVYSEDRRVHEGFFDTVGDIASNVFHAVGNTVNNFLDLFKSGPGVNVTGLHDAAYGPDGQILGYTNDSGHDVRVVGSGDVKQLVNYGQEHTDQYGNVTVGYTLGATGRIFGDLLGFDGSFGIQGTFSKPGEGIAPTGGSASSGDTSGSSAPITSPIPPPNPGNSGSSSSSSSGSGSLQDFVNDVKDFGNAVVETVKDIVDSVGHFFGLDPVLLDLDGNGIQINEVTRSTVFMDTGGDGLLHRTAWAGAGDGVLFYDMNGDGQISDQREFVFTEWDPTAKGGGAARRMRGKMEAGRLGKGVRERTVGELGKSRGSVNARSSDIPGLVYFPIRVGGVRRNRAIAGAFSGFPAAVRAAGLAGRDGRVGG